MQVEMDAGFGLRCPVDLLPGGGNVPVTSANVRQYCELYAQHLLVHSIQKQFAAFQRGFLRLCSGAALQLFRCGAYTLKTSVIGCYKDIVCLGEPTKGSLGRATPNSEHVKP